MCLDKDATPLDEWLPQAIAAELTELRLGLTTSIDTIRHRGARVAKVSDHRPMTSAGALLGYALRETTGAANATVLLRDGATADGAVVIPITLGPNESTRDWFGPGGISFGNGLFVEVAAGEVEGSVFLA